MPDKETTKHIHGDCHVHVRCPECGSNTFEILIYEKETLIKCSTDGTSVQFNKELVDEFAANLHLKN